MNSPLTIAGLTVAALALTASTAAAQMQWTNLGFVNVSIGAQAPSRDLATRNEFDLYNETAVLATRPLQRLRWVTLPTISPVILFAVVLGVIQALQYFTQAYVAAAIAAGQASQAGTVSTLEQGYPEGSTLFYPVLLYYHGFRFFNMGYASAMAMLLLAVAFALTLLIVRNSRRWVHYSGAVR